MKSARAIGRELLLTIEASRAAVGRRLAQLGQVGGRVLGGAGGQGADVQVLGQRAAVEHGPDDGLAGLEVGRQHQQAVVEPAGPAQQGVDVPGVLGGGDHEHPLVLLAGAVELGHQLVDDPAPDRVAAPGPAGADGVELVEVEQAGRAGPGRLEDLVDAAAAVAEPHVDHVGQVDPEEAGPQLPGQGPGQERLAAAGRPVHQQAAAERAAEQPPHLRVAQRGQEGGGQPALDRRHAADVGQGGPRLLDLAEDPLVQRRPAVLGLGRGGRERGRHRERGGGQGGGGPVGQLDGLALAGVEGEHGRAVLQRLGRPAGVQQQGRDMQAQGQVVGHGLDRRPQTVKQLRVDRHGGNSMARPPP